LAPIYGTSERSVGGQTGRHQLVFGSAKGGTSG
jgi:hypothetical protein